MKKLTTVSLFVCAAWAALAIFVAGIWYAMQVQEVTWNNETAWARVGYYTCEYEGEEE